MRSSNLAFDIQPRVAGPVTVGSSKGESLIWAGELVEKGERARISFDASDNFVVLQVGKRGSGKSYGMGALLEGFAVTSEKSLIASHRDRRAVVLLDPLDIHWTALVPLQADGPPGLRAQHRILSGWKGLEAEPINAQVFVPAGFGSFFDHPGFREYRIPVSELDEGDWAILLKADLLIEPRGRLLSEAYLKVTELGWQDINGVSRPAGRGYGIEDLIACIEEDTEIGQVYEGQTRRSVVQPLRSLARMPLFESSQGTPLTEVVKSGVLSVLSLGRLPEDVRTVLVTVFVRKLRADRMIASHILRRLNISPEDQATRESLEGELAKHVPRTVLAIDEAQILIPSEGSSMARKTLDSYVLEGRNHGLSLWLATQRPKGAISERAISQIDTFIVHRLSVAEDIKAVCGLLQSAQPDKIKLRGQDMDLAGLIRSLDVGEAIFSSAVSNSPRLVVGQVRPRVVAHGGDGF